MLTLAKNYDKALEEEEKMTAEQLAIKNVGKLDPKRHLEEKVANKHFIFFNLSVYISHDRVFIVNYYNIFRTTQEAFFSILWHCHSDLSTEQLLSLCSLAA